MVIKSITLRNFMNISSCDLDFTQGINVLSGSIGSGKSAILDAVAFCILDSKRGSSWSEYVKRGEKSFEINIVVEVEPSEDMVFNYKGKASAGSCEKQITYKEQTYLNSDCAPLLESVFDLDMYKNVVFNMQGSENLSSMSPAVIRDIFKKIFNSDFPDIVAKIKEDQSSLKEEVTNLNAKINALQTKNYHFFRIVEVDDSDIESLRKELQDSQASDLDKQKYKLYMDKLKELSSKQNDVNAQASEKNKHLATKKSIEEKIIESSTQKKEKEATLNLLTSEVADLKIQHNNLEKACADLKNALTVIQVKHKVDMEVFKLVKRDLDSQKIDIRTELSITTKHLETHKKGICDSCGQKCDITKLSEFEAKIVELNTSLASIEALLATNKSNVEESEARVAEANKAVLEAQAKVDQIQRFISQKELVLSKQEQDISSLIDNISRYIDYSLSQEDKYIADAESKITILNAVVEELSAWCEANKFELSEDSKTKRPPATIQKELDEVLSQITANIEQEKINQKLSEEKKADQAEVLVLNEKMNDIQVNIKNLDLVRAIWESDFPAYINLQACSILESYMNSFFTNVKPDLKVKIVLDKKGISLLYSADGSDNYGSMKLTSGGEGALTTLGFKVAVAHAFGSDLLILDEPDHANDPESGMKLFEVINNIPNFKQLFVISHKPEAKEFFLEEGANIYNVVKGEFTKVEN